LTVLHVAKDGPHIPQYETHSFLTSHSPQVQEWIYVPDWFFPFWVYYESFP